MGARRKLNEVHLAGGLVLAALAGLWTGSWAVFVAAFAVLVVLDLSSGNVRLGGRVRPPALHPLRCRPRGRPAGRAGCCSPAVH